MKQSPLFEIHQQEINLVDTMNLEQLRPVARYHIEATSYLKRVVDRLEALLNVEAQTKLEIEEKLVWLRREVFGPSTEKRPAEGDSKKREPRKNRKPSGPRVLLPSQKYPNLSVIEETLSLDQNPTCRVCTAEMELMGQTENSETISVVQKIYTIKLQKREKYRCKKCYSDIQTTPCPPRMKPGSQFDDSVAIDVAVAKYADHLPIERYVDQAERCGLVGVHPQTLILQTHYLADRLRPVYEALKCEIKGAAVLFADETPWKMLEGDDRKNWQMWGFFTQTSAYYEARNSRASAVAKEFLKNCSAEFLVSDAYSGYGSSTKGTSIRNVYCNAHARRYFIDAEKAFPEEVQKIIAWYRKIYDIEAEIKHHPPDLRLKERQEKSKPVFLEMKHYLFSLDVLPSLSLGEARAYTLKHWTELTLFLTDGRLPIDNNLAERGLRGIVVGRKNYYGNHSKQGAETTAILYSLIESCKLNHLEPSRYLKETLQHILNERTFQIPTEYKKTIDLKERE